MISHGWRVAVSDFGRFEAALAIDGLCHPPEFFGGPWSRADRAAFRVGASHLAGVVEGGGPIDRRPYLDMEAALHAVRQRVVARDAAAWPALAIRSSDNAPIDYTFLIGWGVRWWHRKLATRRGNRTLYARTAAGMVVSAVDLAIYTASVGGKPAHFDAPLARRIAAFWTALVDINKPDRSYRKNVLNVADLIAIDGAAAARPCGGCRVGH